MSDFEQLLAPISADLPAGTDLRLAAADLTFSTLDELRREADPDLDPGGETKTADWRAVSDLCRSALAGKSKDLELAAVLTQAQTHLDGLTGLSEGLRLVRALVDTYWETITPGYDEGEIIEAIRARPLSWLGTSRDFLSAVKKVPLSAPIGETPRSWFDYEQAQRVDKASTRSDRAEFNELVEMGLITTEAWHASLAATPPERLQGAVVALADCENALRELVVLCDEKFTESAPYFTDLSALLDEMRTFLASFADDGQVAAAAVASDAPAAPGAATGQPVVAAGSPAAAAGPIASRDDAYRRLREVAEFLRRTEPHSPVPPLLDRAVSWGNMTFENLFDDVVKNPDVRIQTRDLLGLPKPQD